MLQIKLEVVSRPGVRFFDSNATRSDARQSTNPSIVRFDVVRAKSQGDVEKSLQRFYQAEVLVPSPIPPHLIVFPKKSLKLTRKSEQVKRRGGVSQDGHPLPMDFSAADVASSLQLVSADVCLDVATLSLSPSLPSSASTSG